MSTSKQSEGSEWIWMLVFGLLAFFALTRNQPGLWSDVPATPEDNSIAVMRVESEWVGRETYVVRTRADCDRLNKHFQSIGRRLTLLNVVANTRRQRNFFPFMCVFEGQDAGDPTYTFDWNDLARRQKP